MAPAHRGDEGAEVEAAYGNLVEAKRHVPRLTDRQPEAKRAEFVALLLASGELMPMAWGRMRKSGVRELAMGAAGVVALRYALTYLVSGPLGIALTGFTVATLISFFWSNQREVMARRKPYRQLISDTREKFEDIQARYQDGRYDSGERALLIEGLLRRMLAEIEAPIELEGDEDSEE